MSALLDSSQGLSEVMEKGAQGSLAEVKLGSVAQLDYPTVSSAALEARRSLLEMGPHAIPVALNAFKGLDLSEWRGVARGTFVNCMLAELCCGHFGWDLAVDPTSASRNEVVVRAWESLWRVVSSDPELVRALVDHRDLHRFSDMLNKKLQAKEVQPVLPEKNTASFIRNEPVLLPGMVVRAMTSNGTIAIQADEGFGRLYSWGGSSRFIVMQPRQERWYGSLGIYYPGPGEHWEENEGIRRGVLSEGQMYFETPSEASEWLASLTYYPHVYRNDGLVVGVGKQLSRKQINVDLWQVYIAGQKPKQLQGANDAAIEVDG